MKTLRYALALAVLGAALTPVAASAYVLDGDGNGHSLRWSSSVVRYRLVSGNVPGGGVGENAVHAAFTAWSAASAGIQYQFDGYSGHGAQAFDNRNYVFWQHSGWSYDPNLLAVTFRYFDTSNGRLLDADIVFNGQRYSWSVGGGGYDVGNAAAHEVGHFSGLGHSPDAEATMYANARPGETKKRTLSGDDVAGLTALYGVGGAGGSQGSGGVVASPGVSGGGGGGGGCSIGGMGGPRADMGDLLWTGMLLVGLALRRRSSRGGRCFGPRKPQAFGCVEGGTLDRSHHRSSGLQHERRPGEALLGSSRHDRLLGSRV